MDALALILGAWTLYFVVHSLLASLTIKRWVARHRPSWMPGYRLGFNLIALLLLIPPLWITYANPGPLLWHWPGWQAWISNGLALVALGLFFWSLRYYDGSEFLGLRQLRVGERSVEDQERLHISPLHRYVRHPWYALGLVLLWTRDMHLAQLAVTLAASLYFVIGSRLEERRLLAYHGAAYARYRQRVPALIPLPWRRLSPAEAQQIVDSRDP